MGWNQSKARYALIIKKWNTLILSIIWDIMNVSYEGEKDLRFEVLMMVKMWMVVFWVVTPCGRLQTLACTVGRVMLDMNLSQQMFQFGQWTAIIPSTDFNELLQGHQKKM
jgi:hypothetical protein